MDAERQAFLAGNVLPSPAMVKSLMVPSGNQGIQPKLHTDHGEAGAAHTFTGGFPKIYNVNNSRTNVQILENYQFHKCHFQ